MQQTSCLCVYCSLKQFVLFLFQIFFFKAYWLNGEIQKGADVEDFLWLTKDELSEYLKSDYYKTVKDFIFEM